MPSPERGTSDDTHGDQVKKSSAAPGPVCSDGLPPGRGHKPKKGADVCSTAIHPSDLFCLLPRGLSVEQPFCDIRPCPFPPRVLGSTCQGTKHVSARQATIESLANLRYKLIRLPPRMTYHSPRRPVAVVCYHVMKGWAEKRVVHPPERAPILPNQKANAMLVLLRASVGSQVGGRQLSPPDWPPFFDCQSRHAGGGRRISLLGWAFVAGRWSLVGRIII